MDWWNSWASSNVAASTEQSGRISPFSFSFVAVVILSGLAYKATYKVIPLLADLFINAGMFGYDLSKKERYKVPESLGIICGTVYLIAMFLFIPFPFVDYFVGETKKFAYSRFVDFLSGLLSICCMILLGFADDVLDLRWRHKLLLPTVASLPLLMTYFVNSHMTVVVMPAFIRGLTGKFVDIGVLYYLYMCMLSVFCTNAINILAGVNGIECGQSVVIGISIAFFNCLELGGAYWQNHLFSLCLIIPYIACSCALLRHNWYPSKVFVGDTFCYFSGMTFAVAAILGHFSKTLLLFFIPQIFNFIFSCPQLFHFLPCPRHRMPRYNRDTDKLEPSTFEVRPNSLKFLPRLMLRIATLLGFCRVQPIEKDGNKTDWVEVTNFTIINFVLKMFGPMHERDVTKTLLFIQTLCSLLAFLIRYPLANLLYPPSL